MEKYSNKIVSGCGYALTWKSSCHDLCICIAAKITILTEKEMSVKLSHSLKLWLSQYNWQSFGEKGKLFKKPDRNSLSPLEFWEFNIHFSFSSRKWGTLFQISLSLLKTGEKNFRFLFLFSKLEISKKSLFLLLKLEKRKSLSLSLFFKFLFLLSKLGNRISGFSFSSQN